MKTRPTRLFRWLLFFLLVDLTGGAGGRSAQAQPAAVNVSCDDDEECSRLADLGREQSQAGRFDAAEQAYKSAYLRRPDVKLLYNLARVLHKAGRPAEAAAYYQKYLEAGAEGSEEQRRKTESYLQQARAEAPSTPRSLPDLTVSSQPQPPPQKPSSQDLIFGRPRWRLIVGGATAGAGLLFLGFGSSALSAQGRCGRTGASLRVRVHHRWGRRFPGGNRCSVDRGGRDSDGLAPQALSNRRHLMRKTDIQAALRRPSMRWLLCLMLLPMAACDSLWTGFQGPNPSNCVTHPGICSAGQVCNEMTQLCEAASDGGVPADLGAASDGGVPADLGAASDGGLLPDAGGPLLRLVAGALGGPGNVDGTGTAARFSGPSGVAVDGAGNLFVADANNYTIRKMVMSTGVVTTLAGTAGMPSSPDGTGAAARFYLPSDVTVDGAGNLFVADLFNNTIRKVVTSTGVVTTLAGSAGTGGSTDGTGAAARFFRPTGVAVDGSGNVFVADYYYATIRKVVTSTGVVTTLAGTAGQYGSADGTGAAAQFGSLEGVAADGAGNLFVADSGSRTIRKVVTSTGAVTTLAGTAGMQGSADGTGAAARFNDPFGVAVDGSGNLFVADRGNNAIRKVVTSTGAVTTLAGSAGTSGSADGTGAAARFNSPYRVAADGAGNVFVADYGNNTIRKVVMSTGAVTTLAGSAGMAGTVDGTGAAARFKGPSSVAVDGAGNFFIADTTNNTIRKVMTSTGAVTTLAGTAGVSGSADGTGAAAQFNGPSSVAVDGAGNLFIADRSNHTIRKVVTSTGAVTTLAGTAGMLDSTNGTGAAARFNLPTSVAVDGSGNLFVADYNNFMIRKVVTSTGAVTTLAGTAGAQGSADGTGAAARFNYPYGVAVDGAGNLFVSDYRNRTIRKVVTSTGAVTTLAGSLAGIPGSADGTGAAAQFNNPLGLAVDGAGNLFVADSGNSTIRKVVTSTGAVTTVVGVAGRALVVPGVLPGGAQLAEWRGRLTGRCALHR